MDEHKYHIVSKKGDLPKLCGIDMSLDEALAEVEPMVAGYVARAKSACLWSMGDGHVIGIERDEYRTLPDIKPIGVFERANTSRPATG